MFVVGLTGGIGSGKSEVARRFAALGVEVADADEAAHAVTARGEPGHRAVAEAFGPDAMAADGTLDRAWLRHLVFENEGARRRLEAIVHPLVLAALAAQAAQWRGAYGMFVVPLLLERGNVASRVDRVLVVDCPEQEQMRRVILRSKLAPEVVRAIMATQLPREARLARADDVIDNGGALEALAPQVERLHAQYLARARGALEAFAQSTDNGGQDRPAPRGGGPP